ncbi:Rap guanine nucleotide exchange factor 2 [Podochytrium sp. JEL0797]|nr:Rap guanine nucleotide exchange factor 2 [Podochytrium sp. JEL0797]
MVERKGKVMESMLLDLTPEVLSQQICIHDFKLFQNIHPIEFLHQIWGSDREMTPYLNFFIDRFDKESYWVATEIVMQKDLKKRTKVLQNFILTTKACQEANNFFSLFSLMSGLGLSPVSRLKKTWEALPEKTKSVYEELEKIIDPSRNMKNYRDLLIKAVPPIVPFLPIYLKDLTFMNDGNAKIVEGMINFEKLRMMGNRVQDIISLVAVDYKYEAKPHIQNYIAKPPIEKNMPKLKEMSLECEKSEK